MALTQKEIASLNPCEKRYQRGCGDGLILVIEPVHKGGWEVIPWAIPNAD